MFARLRFHATRQRLALIGSGILIVVVLSVVFVQMVAGARPPAHPSQATIFFTTGATSTPASPTAQASATTGKPTATPKPHPLPVPQSNPPPPPAVHHPTPTPVPPTTTPLSSTPTPCGTGGCPTATTAPPTPTPGACQPGGPPYYLTPTVTPTTDQIALAITNAAGTTRAHLGEYPAIPAGQDVTIPANLQEAIAWQESGWQQNVIACDGGIGLMQLMPDTAAWLNTHFGTNHNVYDLNGNAHLGAEYLQYYYQFYLNVLYGSYASYCAGQPTHQCDWNTPWPDSTDSATVRDIVISVYNEGAGTMGKYGIINWSYVNDVLTWFHTRYGGVGG